MTKTFISLFTVAFVLSGALIFSSSNKMEAKKIDLQAKQIPTKVSENISNEKGPDNNITNNKVTKVDMHADFENIYFSIEELTQDADVIIKGDVLEANSFDFNKNTFTKSQIKVTESFNDKAKVGDILTFVEVGGTTTIGALASYYPEKIQVNDENKDESVEVTINDSPVMGQGDQVVLFGVKSKDKLYLKNHDYYLPLGTYQGKFDVKNGKIKRFVSQNEGKKYTSLEMTLDEMKNKRTKK